MKANDALRVVGSITYKGCILIDAACNERGRIAHWRCPKRKSTKNISQATGRHTGLFMFLVLCHHSNLEAFDSEIHVCLRITSALVPCPTTLKNKAMLASFLLFVLLYGIIWSSGQIFLFSLFFDLRPHSCWGNTGVGL